MFLQQTGIKDLFLVDKPTFINTYDNHFISPFFFYLIQNKTSFKWDLGHAFSTFRSVNFLSLMFEVLIIPFFPLSLVFITKNIVTSILGGEGGGEVLIPFSVQCLGYRCEGLLSFAPSTWSFFSRIRNKEMHKKSFESNKDKLRNTRIFFSPRSKERWNCRLKLTTVVLWDFYKSEIFQKQPARGGKAPAGAFRSSNLTPMPIPARSQEH